MSQKRKDNKGRILKTGESQRKDSLYQYRYSDVCGKRHSVYASTLQELRKKEAEIQHLLYHGVNYASGSITVVQMVERYITLKQGVRYSTRYVYNTVLNLVKKEEFGYRIIRDLKILDAQEWVVKLQNDGKSYNTIVQIRNVVRPALQMACDDDVIRKNPFSFKLTNVINNNTKKRRALTDDQFSRLMNFLHEDPVYSKHYDEFVILAGTGLRVSEFCGLTQNSIDFNGRTIHVDKQLIRRGNGEYHIEPTKTDSGDRFIPMTDEVFCSLQNVVAKRRSVIVEPLIDGHSKFLFLNNYGNPKVATNVESVLRRVVAKYNKLNPNTPLPNVTPHVLRHTFCTRLANSGMDVKALQYIMGHSDVTVTMGTYADKSQDHASKQMRKVVGQIDVTPI